MTIRINNYNVQDVAIQPQASAINLSGTLLPKCNLPIPSANEIVLLFTQGGLIPKRSLAIQRPGK